jgi:hypothetical protein
VVAALAVPVGLNEPQVAAGVQLQFTPRVAGSPVTVAAMVAVAPAARDDGGGVVNATEITVALIAMEALLALIVLVVTEVAMSVTAATGALGAV